MAYQVLARKWRPTKFEEVIGQDHIIKSIKNAVLKNKVGHAYLLTGTRGVGKTTIARILAKVLRCENLGPEATPCDKCSSCQDFSGDASMNILEIDGASNNGIDNIRELIANVQYLPTSGSKKIYIIDEVHMVTTSAFNALLKTLEEPPAHVIFIFATTEPDKLMGTVLSRCQRFDLRQMKLGDLVSFINKIAAAENIKFENKSLVELICRQGNGSVRDTLSILDQILSYSLDNFVTEEIVASSLGIAKASALADLALSMFSGDVALCSKIYRTLIYENVAIKNIVSQLLDFIFDCIEALKNNKRSSHHLDLSLAELYWIYETISRDSVWATTTISSVNVVEIILQKITLRRTFFNKTISVEKKNSDPLPSITVDRSPAIEDRPPLELSLVKEEARNSPLEKNWEGFLHYLAAISPVSVANLEQGNITKISNLANSALPLEIELSFGEAEQVFYEHLQEKSVQEKLIEHLSEYFSKNKSNLKLEFKLINAHERERTNFQSRMEQKLEDEEKNAENWRQELLNDEIILSAEKLFNSKIDKVVINKQQELKK
ncbi:MAG: DNA polymerase III, subunit gamma and tau [Bdellovibrionales bacterium RIFOXYD12_FULL_39_22]|nr:MAG: DNA polymerase III, subunit gamma and tau [Bdellovibrionales bacterium RIFOXYB1_FULL_39_21]OFZ41389.1 MAG: DNA polymerase III, subunit gamma and tau [Bdellovibrionales bacterium RIFOXYC12_FULL_39_17]OFZ45344.1 MAG: DNA polymerase III, subunit gamma and tau [Bdellovibrionales bacterium RIFOXYC1_FULL_39_130]OFZ74540.1 MAG: DNA polymerase III, subunit gamma and tau [Bdellovibrionales bacterium RIFOXYD1_FULL_39_84]OFZ92549.1 MAG: DNA polymerase III, subunit gamma and tau [Bdellovibrionales 